MFNFIKAFFLPRTCSREASVDKAKIRSQVFSFIMAQGRFGCTDEEGQIATGIPGNTWRPARLELEEMRLVGLTGEKRRNRNGRYASVWVMHEHAKVMRGLNG